MPNVRKTVHIRDLIDEVNRLCAESTLSSESRKGACMVLEFFLHKCNAYAGFGFLEQHRLRGLAADELPGIIPGYDPVTGERDNSLNVYPDEWRRFYYVAHNLK